MQIQLGRACAANINLGDVGLTQCGKARELKIFNFVPKTSQFFSFSSCAGIDYLFLYHFEDYGKDSTCGPVGLESCEG